MTPIQSSVRSAVHSIVIPKALRFLAALAAAVLISGSLVAAHAQGCVAARSGQQTIDQLCSTDSDGGSVGPNWLHNRLTVDVGYRNYSSFRHYIGTVEQVQRQIQHTQVENHANIWNVGVEYRVSPRWSILADVPIFNTSRNRPKPEGSRVTGVGDILIGGQTWLFRPPTESNGNIAFNFMLKIPTGTDNALTPAGTTADQSIQTGDGSWGFQLGTQSYKQIWFQTMLYFEGSWLFNPRDTNGVQTYRTQPGEEIMSVPDQYLFRGGFAHAVPKIRRLSLSLGGRIEGVPVRDAFGSSNGFRRPGYIISLDPGLMYSFHREVLSVYGPWALERNRTTSVPDLQYDRHGDAAFADYTLIVSLSHHF